MLNPLLAIAIRGRRWLASLVPTRNAIVVAVFLTLAFGISYLGAFFLRGEMLILPADARQIVRTIWWVLGIKLAVFYGRGFCHRRLHAARFEDLNLLVRVTTLAMLVVAAVNFYCERMQAWVGVPRSVLLLDWLCTILIVGGAQAMLRSIYEEIVPSMPAGGQVPVLVVDASAEGRALAQALRNGRKNSYFVAGLLDDDPSHYGVHIGSARVLGPVGVAPACAERLRIREIIVLEGALFGARLRALCQACEELDVRLLIASLQPGRNEVGDPLLAVPAEPNIRDVELRDLLSRPQVRLAASHAEVRSLLAGSTVLVTGAGGSIGSEICRQVLRFGPKRLVLVERSEVALFTLMQGLETERDVAGTVFEPVLLDIGHAARTSSLLGRTQPDVVVHAAAFKHLPLMEDHPTAAIENNALATATLADLASQHGVKTFVALSTDKAVYPSSVMGASKLLAERYLQAAAEESDTRFVVVRFGNVLASSGSAVPIFEEKLRAGRPITVTHRDVRRFFMTIDEAAQLVLVAASTAACGGTYVLQMGEPIRIVDLVHSLAYVMKIPQQEVLIEYCGLRPGEKLDEELFFSDEAVEPTGNPLVLAATRPGRTRADVRGWFEALAEVIDEPEEARELLMRLAEEDSEQSRNAGPEESEAGHGGSGIGETTGRSLARGLSS